MPSSRREAMMEPTYNYIFSVKKTPDGPEEVIEIYAPSFVKAIMIMARAWPGVHVVKHLGIAPQKKGIA